MTQGSQALTHGPYVSTLTYPFFTSDHASIDSLLAGSGNILDYPPDFADLQTAFATSYVNVTTEFGGSFENIDFNMYCTPGTAAINCPLGNVLPFRQAIAHIFNMSYAQKTILNGVQGLVSQNVLIPQAFGQYSTPNINIYQNSLSAATAALAKDPQLAWAPTAHPTNGASGSEYSCTTSQTGVWQYATAMGSGHPNGTDATPTLYTRPDHPTWKLYALQIWNDAAKIGLCIDLKQVVHFSGIKPIVYTAYSNKYTMYTAGASYSAPLNPVGTLYFSFGEAGIVLGPLLGDTTHFDNATFNALVQDAYTTGSVTQAQTDSQKAVQLLSYQIPSFNIWWDAWSIPSLNSHGDNYYGGYVDVPGFGSWSFATGYYTALNFHKIDPTTGVPETGGNLVVNLHEAPDDYNLYQAGSVYDLDVINSIFFDTPVEPPAGAPFIGQTLNYPWMLTAAPTYTPYTGTTPHGYSVKAGTVITLNFMQNITWSDNTKFTANDYNFTLWYNNLNGAYGPYVNNCANYCGEVPTLFDSQVTTGNPYQLKLYVNSTSATDFLYLLTAPPTEQRLWSQVTTAQYNGDIDPTTNYVNNQLLETGTGGFYWGSSVSGQYVTLDRNPGYFRTNIQAWQLPQVQIGNAEPLSFAVTQAGVEGSSGPTVVSIPSSAHVTAWATLGSTKVSAPLTLNSNGNWTGSFSTTGWAPGFYEVTVNGTYTDSSNVSHEALQFYGLNVVSPPPPTLSNLQVTVTANGSPVSGATVTVGSVSGTTNSAGVVTLQNLQPGSATITVTASGYDTATQSVTLTAGQTGSASVSLTTDYTLYYVGGVVVVIILIAAGVAYSRRGKT